MGRDNRHSVNRVRRGSGTTPLLVASVCFAIVLGLLFYAIDRTNSQTAADHKQSAEIEDRSTASVDRKKGASEDVADSSDRHGNAPAASLPAADPVRSGEFAQTTSSDEETTELDRLQEIKAHLEFGEFGPALEIAESAPNIDEQLRLAKAVVDAQLKIGELEAALTSVRRVLVPDKPFNVRRQQATLQALSLGGGANFGPLIELIKSETDSEWEEDDGQGGSISPFDTAGGVLVHPDGLMANLTAEEKTGRLEALGIQVRVADVNEDMARPSDLRIVSLTRLEREVAKRLERGEPVVETMKHLAGLRQVRYVFIYPEEKEVVIAGPAEGWQFNALGHPVGVESGKPTLQLDDLVTVLRTFSGGNELFGCSINPRKEGLKRVNEFVTQSTARGPLSPGAPVRNWVNQLRKLLGLQDIELFGIPHESRVARVIVEADYRMKLIGVGKLDGGPGIPSFLDLLPVSLQKKSSLDALRWWLTMKYDAILHSPDRSVFEIVGSSVLCQSENELITAQGERVHTGKSEATNRLFAQNFTNHYGELAEHDLVFADLQNIFDLALAAALLRHEQVADRIGWDFGVFAPNGAYQLASYQPPQTVDSVVSYRVYRGRDIVVQVAGGVRADLMAVVRNNEMLKPAVRLKSVADRSRPDRLPEGQWWWDAKQ